MAARDPQVVRSVRAYARRHRTYDKTHGEIFNDVEQERLADALRGALEAVRSTPEGGRLRALDVGAGTGNLTAHFVRLGLDVVSADVSPEFLRLVAERFLHDRVVVKQLDGATLGGLSDESFDLVGTYSVLHHVPDYLGILDEMVRVTKPGGVIFIDHEGSEAFWDREPLVMEYRRLRDEAIAARAAASDAIWNPRGRRWQRFISPQSYMWRARLLLNPKYQAEGDIHVFPDDHIEWSAVRERLIAGGCEIVLQDDYLRYGAEDSAELHREWAGRCHDTTALTARRLP